MNINELNAQLANKLKEKPRHMSADSIRSHHEEYIAYHNEHNPDNILAIPIEEMAELTQHLCKIMRGLETCDTAVLEEMADVEICLENLKIYFDIDSETIEYIKDIKLERAHNKIKNATM